MCAWSNNMLANLGQQPTCGLLYLQVLFHPTPKKVASIIEAWAKSGGGLETNTFAIWF